MKKLFCFLFFGLLLCGCTHNCLLSQVNTQTINAGANCSAPIPDFRGLVTVSAGCSGSVLTQTPVPGTIITTPNTTVVLKTTSPNGKWSQTSFLMIMNIVDTITPVIIPVTPPVTPPITPPTGYYVSPSGNDSNPGTITLPWKSLNYAFNKLVAGDNLILRGGTYTVVADAAHGINLGSKNGTATKLITVLPYNNEISVFDCSGLSASSGDVIGLEMTNCSYWNIKGLNIKNVPVPTSQNGPGPGCSISGCKYITFDQVNVSNCGNGFISYVGDYIYYKNCDSYANGVGVPYFGNNGFYASVTGGLHVTYDGCRAWENGQDGWDCFVFTGGGSGYITYNQCWSWNNAKTYAGSGFKTGVTSGPALGSAPQRTLTNCIAAGQGGGYDESQDLEYGYSIPTVIYNCISYNNGTGFQFSEGAGQFGTLYLDIIRNNISFGDTHTTYNGTPSGFGSNTADHNSWNIRTMTSGDFQSTDISQLSAQRKSDGSLPDVTFLHLSTTATDFIDTGINVGLPYLGNSPDIGAFELK
jgi:hypothetical protein